MPLVSSFVFDKFAVNLGFGLKLYCINPDIKFGNSSIEFSSPVLINSVGDRINECGSHLYESILGISNSHENIIIGENIYIKRIWLEVDDTVRFKFDVSHGFIDGRFNVIDNIDSVGFYYFSNNLHKNKPWWNNLVMGSECLRVGSWYDIKWSK